jgi:hypothetical protein
VAKEQRAIEIQAYKANFTVHPHIFVANQNKK